MIVRRVVGVDPAGGIKHPRDHRVTTYKSQCHATREMAHGAGGAVRQHGRVAPNSNNGRVTCGDSGLV